MRCKSLGNEYLCPYHNKDCRSGHRCPACTKWDEKDRAPKQDVIIERPEETPGYGFGVQST